MKILKIKDNINLKNYGFEKDDDDFLYQDNWGLILNTDKTLLPGQFFGDNEEKRLIRLYNLIKEGVFEIYEI